MKVGDKVEGRQQRSGRLIFGDVIEIQGHETTRVLSINFGSQGNLERRV